MTRDQQLATENESGSIIVLVVGCWLLGYSDSMKLWVAVILGLFLVVLFSQAIDFLAKRDNARAEYDAAETALREAEKSREGLRADLEYYGDPENLERELRARFNYRAPGEKTIILIEPQGEPSTSSTQEHQ